MHINMTSPELFDIIVGKINEDNKYIQMLY